MSGGRAVLLILQKSETDDEGASGCQEMLEDEAIISRKEGTNMFIQPKKSMVKIRSDTVTISRGLRKEIQFSEDLYRNRSIFPAYA
ncbi:hypothetical protein CEXT_770121 [Caerostris extrusa]|uniref:Uncharacterized protein n=1 Tax=Caerostris extrusa TaxID=172846 RepID=A0AAV4N289_CAEEX|nr:hypothetical protein CEXT_770121 [Caerostris extrusa]